MANGPWIPLYCALKDSPKLIRLAATLKVADRDHIRAKIENLWMWAMMQRPDGILDDFSAAEVADASGWKGNPDLWLAALTDKRHQWLVRMENGTLKIHDWDQYGGKLLRRQEASREAMKRFRDKEKTGGPAVF